VWAWTRCENPRGCVRSSAVRSFMVENCFQMDRGYSSRCVLVNVCYMFACTSLLKLTSQCCGWYLYICINFLTYLLYNLEYSDLFNHLRMFDNIILSGTRHLMSTENKLLLLNKVECSRPTVMYFTLLYFMNTRAK